MINAGSRVGVGFQTGPHVAIREDVRIGDHWFRHLCARRCLDPEATFRRLVKQYMDGKLRGPFNWDARLAAGFKTHELEALERGL